MVAVRGTVGAAMAACLLTLGTFVVGVGADEEEGEASALDLRGISGRAPAETCVPAQIPFDAEDIDLTGRWSADDDGMYYVRQIGDTVWWNGMSDYEQQYFEMGRDWNNVGRGTLKGTLIEMEWADVPHGSVWGGGNLTVRVEADADGNLRARRNTGDNFGGTIFTPCAPEAQEVTSFAVPFEYTVPWGMSSATWTNAVDQKVFITPDARDAGMTFWLLGPGMATMCSAAPGSTPPADPSPESIVEYLRTIPELDVAQPVSTTVGGLPALQVDIGTVEGATGCNRDGYVRFWKESGREGSLEVNERTRLVLVDLGGSTFAIEAWGPDQEAWWPLAQDVIDSVALDPGAALTETIGEPADDGARIVRVDAVNERIRDLVIESPSVGYARVRLLLPDGFEEGSAATWPTLYLLHGAWDDYTSWTRETDVEDIPELRDVLVVMPDAGEFGWYSDWENDGAAGQPAWETFHTVELPQLIESNWGAGQDRVVAGLSMGGFGALSYAARHPGMFKAAAAYSAVADTLGSDFEAEPLMWGDKTEDRATWESHNPVSQAAALEGTDLYISFGNGTPGDLDSPDAQYDGLEGWLRPQNDALVAELTELGIPATVDYYGEGTHTWPYWERALHASLPVLLGGLEG
jgi:S-formylglutathione hydrolase FrmB